MTDEVPVATPDGQVIAVWYVRAGATFIKRYQWLTGGVKASPGVPGVPPTPVDLTGWVARMKGVYVVKDGPDIPAFDLDSPTDIVLDAQGNVTTTLLPDLTRDMPAGKITFYLELESPTGFVRSLVGGTIVLARNIPQE